MINSRLDLDQVDLDALSRVEENKQRHADSIILVVKAGAIEFVGYGSVSIKNIIEKQPSATFQMFNQVIRSLAMSARYAPVTLKEYVWALDNYSENSANPVISIESLDQYREYLNRTRSRFFYALKRLLMHWYVLGYPGVSQEVYQYLSTIPGAHIRYTRGRKIHSSNPEEGWYDDQEYEDLIAIYWDEYDTNEVTLAATIARLLTAQYCRRPIQLAHLKICDIKDDGESYGVVGPRIEFPGAKSREGGFRTGNVETHPLSQDLLALCKAQAEHVIDFMEDYLGIELSAEYRSMLPLFLPKAYWVIEKNMTRLRKYEKFGKKLGSRFLHISPDEMSRLLIRTVGVPVISHRTGNVLVEGAYRMRYTRPRQLARAGLSRAALIYWMGHTSLGSIESYYDDPAEDARIIDDATKTIMGPIAQAFRGTLRKKESDATRGDDPASRIELDGKVSLGIGTCGSFGECHANVPIPCYRCRYFQPWVNGPHKEVLKSLIERKKMEDRTPAVGMHRDLLHPIQLAKDIEAVKLVIALCKEFKRKK